MTTYYDFDRAVIMQIIYLIENQLSTYYNIPLEDLRVVRNNQPTQQHAGAVTGSKKYQVFISQVPSGQTVGEGYNDEYTEGDDYVERTHYHIRRRVLQIECWSDFDPSDLNSLEGEDLAGIVRELLCQQEVLEELTEKSIYLQRTGAVRPIFAVNDQEQYQSTPSFDLTLTYNRKVTKDRARVVSIDGTQERF